MDLLLDLFDGGIERLIGVLDTGGCGCCGSDPRAIPDPIPSRHDLQLMLKFLQGGDHDFVKGVVVRDRS